MKLQNAPEKKEAWQVIRQFDGRKDPQALLRTLIQAHQR